MKNKILAALIALMALGQVARGAENGWTISSSTSGGVTTFTISRTNTAVAETVRYRLVNLSAYAGQHYNVTQVNGQSSNALSGEFTFAAGENGSRTIQVTESAGSGAYSYYKDNTQRSYKLELTDAGGFYLTSNTRSFTTGTSINSTNAFGAKEVDVNTGTITVTDDNYSQAYHAVPVATYFNSAAPKNYLVAAGAELRMTLSFQAKEKDDGYQHVQILVNQTSNHDEGSGDNNPGTMNYSSYMATFCHKGGSTNTTYSNYVFPDVSHNNNCGNVGLVWSSINSTNDVGELRQQYFNTDCRATDGRLIIAGKSALSSFSTLGIRFDASGNNEDTWYAYNVKAKIQAVDATAPTVIAYSVAPGYHAKGNTVYVSVAFSEIVTTSSAKLTSNWGDLSYVAGSGTNVLTFSRTIPDSASSALNITGFSGITDLAGKAPSSVTASNLCSLDDSYAYTITYNLDGGSADNPATYTYETATFTLTNPTKLGYYFDGWTGSNGSTPGTTVTIANHSHGNKTFTANWTKVWNGSGTSGDPYIITTTKGLDLLAMYVNGLGGNSAHDCSGVYFQLGGDITYTHTTVWNNASSTENNYTAIGTYDAPFKGTFDGQDHTVSGIRIYKFADFDQGLFGRISSGGTVRRVNLANARITGRNEVGGVAGHIFSSTVEDCSVAADVCIHSHSVSINCYCHGGIVGSNQGTVQRCLSRATLSAATASDCRSYGAIVGDNNNAAVLDCIAVGATVPSASKAGAIVGENNLSTYNVQRNYYRACTVAGTANATGVGVGYHSSNESPHDITANQGAQALYRITLPGDVTLVRTASATLPGTGNATYTTGADIDGVPYAFDGASLTLSYTGSIPDGGNVIYKVNGTAIDGNSFTMPAQDVTITTQLLSTVSHIDANGNAASQAGCIPISNANFSQSYGEAGQTNWYYVSGDVSTKQLTFKDASANIILCDGATLNISVTSSFYGLYGSGGSISIFAQSGGTGVYSFSGGVTCINAYYNVDINGATITGDNCDYGISASNGDVTIRGGNVSVSGKYAGIYAQHNINITGGIVSVSGQDGMSASNRTITLGYTSASDRITASSYACNTLKVVDGQTLTDGTAAYTGTLTADQKNAIAGRTLRPYAAIPDQLTLVQGTKDGITAYWGTFYASGSGYTLPAGAAAYTMDAEYHLYRLGTDGSVIPAGTAVVIIADQATVSLTASAEAQAADNAPGGNILVGVDVDTLFDTAFCVLSKNASGKVGFYPLSGIALPAHKAGYVPKGGLKDYQKEDGQQW